MVWAVESIVNVVQKNIFGPWSWIWYLQYDVHNIYTLQLTKNMSQLWNLVTNISEFHLQDKEATFTAEEGNRLFQIIGNQCHYKILNFITDSLILDFCKKYLTLTDELSLPNILFLTTFSHPMSWAHRFSISRNVWRDSWSFSSSNVINAFWNKCAPHFKMDH